MRKMSTNQEASLQALRSATVERGVDLASLAVWRRACPKGISVYAAAMVRTGTVVAVKAGVSRNGSIIELYKPAT